MRSKTLLENIVPAIRFAFELLNRGVQVFDGRLFLGLPVLKDHLCFRIDLQRRSTAGALDFKDRACNIRHRGIVAPEHKAELRSRSTRLLVPVIL